MKYSLHRQILLKGIDAPNLPNNDEPKTTPEQLATPRFISPVRSGAIAAKLAGKKPPLTLPNRAYVRNATSVRRERHSIPPHPLAMTRELPHLRAWLREEKRWQRRCAHWLRAEQKFGET